MRYLILLSLLLIGCNNSKSQFVGSWKFVSDNNNTFLYPFTVKIKEDQVVDFIKNEKVTQSGNWQKISNNSLKFEVFDVPRKNTEFVVPIRYAGKIKEEGLELTLPKGEIQHFVRLEK